MNEVVEMRGSSGVWEAGRFGRSRAVSRVRAPGGEEEQGDTPGKRGGGPALLSSVPSSRATPAPPRRGGGGWWERVQGSSTETLISANLQS